MTHHQKKLAQVCQLLALARSTTFPKERESAQNMAKKLMERHGITGPEVVAFRMSLNPKRPRPRSARPRPTVVYAQPGIHIRVSFSNASWQVFTTTDNSSVY